MKIAYITAGAAGMYCGSCLRDNALARALLQRGHDVLLVPTYTPTKTDEPNVSLPRVFLGGINVYLQNKSAIFRHTPWFLDQLLDTPRLLNWASSFGVKTDAAELGALTVSMLQGEDGPDQKEFDKLATWLADEVRPDIVNLPNSLLIAAAAAIRHRANVPIVCSLSGEDLFLDGLPELWRRDALTLLRRRVADVDAFVTFSRDYAGFMAELLHIPESKLFHIPIGISLDGHGPVELEGDRRKTRDEGRETDSEAPASGDSARPAQSREPEEYRIGFLSRICPDKGLHVLCEAFRMLRAQPRFARCRLRIAGYLGEQDRPFWEELHRQIARWGLRDFVDYAGELDRAGKIRFLQSLDVFSVPSLCRESKGLPVLEAWANRVPVVQPWHGIYTELVNASDGGVLVPANDPPALADAIAQLLDNPALRHELGRRGRDAVERLFTADRMAEATLTTYRTVIGRR